MNAAIPATTRSAPAKMRHIQMTALAGRSDGDVVAINKSGLAAVALDRDLGYAVCLDPEANTAGILRPDWHPCYAPLGSILIIDHAEGTKDAVQLRRRTVVVLKIICRDTKLDFDNAPLAVAQEAEEVTHVGHKLER
jgi:hypothetical protein